MENFILAEYLQALADKLDSIRYNFCYGEVPVVSPKDNRVVNLTEVVSKLNVLADRIGREK